MNVTPSSIARRSAASDSSSSAPTHWLWPMPQAPKPTSETSMPVRPSVRWCMSLAWHAMEARVVSVNVGTPRLVDTGKRQVSTAIWKAPVAGRVPVAGVNLRGDDQADRTVHGGPDKAVYAYATEDTA